MPSVTSISMPGTWRDARHKALMPGVSRFRHQGCKHLNVKGDSFIDNTWQLLNLPLRETVVVSACARRRLSGRALLINIYRARAARLNRNGVHVPSPATL